MKSFKIKLPMLAVIMGLIALIGTAAVDADKSVQQTQQWVISSSTLDPLDPESYEPYDEPGGLEELCEQVSGICGIIAPADPSDTEKPDLRDPELQERITDEDTSEGDVFLLPEM